MSGIPAYVQVAEDLRFKIRQGVFPPGSQLPSMTQLRESYTVSSTVIRSALNELRRDGLIVGQQGKGVFVREQPEDDGSTQEITELRRRLDDLTETVRRLDDRLTMVEHVAEGAAGRS
ncbi:GntR family transcriptional regulator [Microbispora sp. NBC_01389]|uniref:GntR family transcriptional regulator n=1 Tax=Microbispora sp. NBC_01389 TaxID=2903584 RepID=UPI00324FBABB